jgi:uncharacterized membrane protein (DUF106 family)
MLPIMDILGIGMKVLDKFFPDPEQKAKAQLELMQMQQNGELAKMQADMAEQQELTKRHTADMASDSWLSKNIRPLMLICLFSAYTVFSIASVFDYEAKTAYIELLGQWGMLPFVLNYLRQKHQESVGALTIAGLKRT